MRKDLVGEQNLKQNIKTQIDEYKKNERIKDKILLSTFITIS